MSHLHENNPLISIIIVIFNERDYLQQVYREIKQNTLYQPYEIIVVDNNSNDNPKEWILQYAPEIRYIPLKKNIGFGPANNIGIKKARGKYLVFLNADSHPREFWLKTPIEVMEKKKEIGLLGGHCINWQLENPEIKPQPELKIFYPKATLSGAYMIYRANLIREKPWAIFDPMIFMYGEDEDLCYSVFMRSHLVGVVPTVFVYHGRNIDKISKISATFNVRRKYRIMNWSYLYVKYKWFGFHVAFFMMGKLLFLGLYNFIKNREREKLEGNLDAIIDFFRRFKQIRYVRKETIKGLGGKKNFKKKLKALKKRKMIRISNENKYIDPHNTLGKGRRLFQPNWGIMNLL